MGAKYRHALPQLSGDTFLTDAGIETDLIFNHGIAGYRWPLQLTM